jgi:hypothetical protein
MLHDNRTRRTNSVQYNIHIIYQLYIQMDFTDTDKTVTYEMYVLFDSYVPEPYYANVPYGRCYATTLMYCLH